MPITLYHGPAGSGKTNHLLDHLQQQKFGGQNILDSFYYVVPTGSAIDLYQKKITGSKNSAGIFLQDSLITFDRLLLKLLKQFKPTVHRAPPSLSRHIIRTLVAKNNYATFLPIKKFPGQLAQLATTLILLKKNGVGSQTFAGLMAPHMSASLEDLIKIFSDYQAELQKINHYDEGDLYLEVLAALKNKKTDFFSGIQALFVDRLFPITVGQREIIKAIADACPHLDIILSTSFDYQEADDQHFYPAYAELGRIAGKAEYFHYTNTQKKWRHASFTDPAQECEWIVQQLEAYWQQGTAWNRMGILLPQAAFYHKHLSQVLTTAKIPFTPSFNPPLAAYARGIASPAKEMMHHFLLESSPDYLMILKALETREQFSLQWNFEQSLAPCENAEITALGKSYEESLIRIKSRHNPAGVALVDPAEALCHDFEILFVPSFTSGHYPSPAREHPFFTHEMFADPNLREILQGPVYNFGLQKHRLTQIVNRTATHVLCTWPRTAWAGTHLSPSRLLDHVDAFNSVAITEFSNPPERPHPPTSARQYVGMSVSPDTPTYRHTDIPTYRHTDIAFPKHFSKTWSVSEISCYQNCPYQYYARYHLRLGEIQKEEHDVPSDVRGRFVHRILDRVIKEQLQTYREAIDYDLYVKQLQATVAGLVTEEGARDAFLKTAPAVQRETFGKRVTEVLGELIAAEIRDLRSQKKKTFPKYAEWAFGKAKSPPFKIKSNKKNIYLSGRIDRIDVAEKDHLFSVIDYKTGDLDSATSLKEGRSIQLPVYMMAVQDLLLPHHQVASGMLLGMKELGKRSGLVLEGSGEEDLFSKTHRISPDAWSDIQKQVSQNIVTAVEHIEDGDFAPKPVNTGLCRFCDYRDICHYEA